MKTEQIREAHKALKAVSTKKLPVKMTIAVAFNLRKIEKIVTDIDSAVRDIILKYIEVGADGNPIIDTENNLAKIKPDCIEEYREAEKAITEREYGIELDKITIKDIEEAFEDRYDSLTAEEVCGLAFMTE